MPHTPCYYLTDKYFTAFCFLLCFGVTLALQSAFDFWKTRKFREKLELLRTK